MPTSIKNMVSEIECCYPAIFNIVDIWGNEIIDANLSEDDDKFYDPAYYNIRTHDSTLGTPYYDSIESISNNNLNKNNAVIVINPSGSDHHGPIKGVDTNYDDQKKTSLHKPTS